MRAALRILAPIRPIASRVPRTSFNTVLRASLSTSPCRMSGFTHVNAKGIVPPVGPYSHAIKTPTAIYCSGQLHLDPAGTLTQGTIGEKTALCLKNLQAVLEEAGSSIDKIVKVNIFLADMADFADMNKEYEKWITHKPARSCVAVKELPKGGDVEIEAIALP